MTEPCPICESPAEFSPSLADAERVTCPVCGGFKISGTWQEVLKHRSFEERQAKLAEAKRRSRPGEIPYIGPKII